MRKILGVCALVAALVGATAASAHAALTVNVFDPEGFSLTCVDNDAGCDTNPLVDIVDLAVFETNHFRVEDLIAIAGPSALGVASLETRRIPGSQDFERTLFIESSEIGFVGALPSASLESNLEVEFQNGAAGNRVLFESFADAGNTLFAESTAAPVIELSIAGTGADSGSSSTAFNTNAAYSLTNRTTVELQRGVSAAFVRRVGTEGLTFVLPGVPSIPEPNSLALLGVALVGAGRGLRRRFRA